MQNTATTRTNRYGIDLNSIKPFLDNPDYVSEVIARLQATKQNLSTKDLINLLSDDTNLTYRDLNWHDMELALLTHISNSCGLCRDRDIFDLYVLIKNYLSAVQSEVGEDYYCNVLLLNADLPSKSTLNPKKLAVWRNTSKMGSLDTRQAVSVRKWIGSTLVGLTDDQQEVLAAIIDRHLQGDLLDKLDVRHHDSYDFEAWERAYVNDAIRSCMNPLHTSCEVGTQRTFTTYCSGYHGLPDNGLNLTVLYQDDEPVARAITFLDGEQACYIRSYGDDRLHKWLQANGYEQSDFVCGTILYTTEDLLKPYVDGGDLYYADHYTTSDGKHYWELCTDGEYNLQTTDAYAYQSVCECCNNRFHDNEISSCLSEVNGDWYTVCDYCRDDYTWQVYTGGRYTDSVFFHDGYAPDSNSDYVEYDGEYYERDALDEYDLMELDGEVHHIDNLYQCEITGEWFADSSDVYTDADDIPTDKPVFFPYDCVSAEYWFDNVVECTCGTLALERDVHHVSMPHTDDICLIGTHYYSAGAFNKAGHHIVTYRLRLDAIERHCDDLDDEDKAEQYLTLCREYERIQSLIAQELGI